MARHKTFFGKIFGWIGDLFHGANENFLKAAVDITQKVKEGLNSGAADLITSLIPGNIDNKIVEILKDKLPILLADELMIQSAGTPATEADAQALAKKLVDSFNGLPDEKKEKFYTSVAAEIYIFLQKHSSGEKVTFGEAAAMAESAYRSWLQLKQDDGTITEGTVVNETANS